MKQLIQFGVGLSLCFTFAATACANQDGDSDECVFDDASVSEARYSDNPVISQYSWNSQDKTAKGVLTTGSLFHVQHWLCQHYGVRSISLVGPLTDIDPKALTSEFIALANASLDNNEAKLVRRYLAENPPAFDQPNATMVIDAKQYAEFTLIYNIVSDLAVLEIKHYRD